MVREKGMAELNTKVEFVLHFSRKAVECLRGTSLNI